MYDQILHPTDGSEGAAAVADHVGVLAERFDATVHVLAVADTRNRFESPSSGLAPEVWEEREKDRAEAAVDDTVETLPDSTDTERVVESGVPHEAILTYAEEAGMDVIVMGTHGRTGLDHYLIGSVAERVVRRSSVPVLTVRIGEE
ncbi:MULTISPECIES: universal stress protein [Halolamina]|uniref:Nucleotide-binding universal stress protein, UspA family n=1 Tax=Halolamina pelagica TaxID=699431 RepID=A0A1I5RL51_9EURY|nr:MULTISPECIES: universal stress protein [Halolamina]NHX35219.1 universal stress protein [Halolamina sp. R1-12]SFP58646.1 Nucleotide-binding universal stress protein, UspA family [Halolamina pelagica]